MGILQVTIENVHEPMVAVHIRSPGMLFVGGQPVRLVVFGVHAGIVVSPDRFATGRSVSGIGIGRATGNTHP